jgi:hypothetical protein
MFVSPIFLLAGSLLVGIPIIIHVLNRRRFKIVNWAAMEFLLRAMQKNRKRLRFEQMLLLVTRCLVLFLLGAALARPMGCEQSTIADLAGRRTGLHVFVIDNSYSMAYEADRPGAKTQLDQAKIIAKALIERLSSGGECVAVVTAGRPATAVIATPSYDLKEAEAAIDRIQQSYDGTDEVGALSKARDIASADNKDPNKSLYLIDDSTRVGWETSGDAIKQTSADLAKVYVSGITHFNLGKPDEWNHAIVALKPAESLVTNWFPPDFIADVRGYGPTTGDPKITWFLDGDLQPPGGATAKATEAAAPITTTLHSLAGGIHVISAALTSDDRLPIDNTRYRVVNVVNQLKVLIVEGERGVGGLGSSGAFLDDALNPPMVGADATPGHKTNSYVATERISDLELANKVLTDYRCICLCGVGQIQEQEAAQLETFVKQGGTLMVFMGDPVTADNYNATLYKHHLLPGPLTRRVTAGVGPNDPPRRFAFDPHGNLHPLLDDFRNFDDSGMNAVEIYNYWQVDIPPDSKAEHVLDFLPPDNAKDQKPDPAITVQTLGSGRVLFYATAADPNGEWTTFMAHRAFPALMHMLLLGTVSAGDEWMNILVDQPVEVPASINLATAPTLTDSRNIEFPMEQVTNAAGQSVYQSKPLAIPGIYSLSTGTENFKIAVNVPSDEADVRTITSEQVKKDMGDIDMRLEGDSVPAPSIAANEGLDMGWSVMVIVFLLLAVECLMAMMFGHHRRKAA